MTKFKITLQARADIRKIWRYTAKTWNNSQATQYSAELYSRFKWLSENPLLGKHRPDVNGSYYSYVQNSHIIFYMINDDNINIIGIPHQSMDVELYFESNKVTK